MGYIKCCVSNCNAAVLLLHRFPNPTKYLPRFKDRKRVCHKHFDSQFYSEGHSRLHINAIPTLNLPIILRRLIATDSTEHSDQSHSTFTEDHTLLQEPSTSDSFMYSLQGTTSVLNQFTTS
ncbi:hypothetical protein FQA39_LY07049 [Lamprigera yunnana]|nr:hypothetical protein FQA39_LY07049 [Lamprigera yunnana]